MRAPEFDDKWKEAYIRHASADGYFGPFNWDEIIPRVKWSMENLYDENGDLIEDSPYLISSVTEGFDDEDNEETAGE